MDIDLIYRKIVEILTASDNQHVALELENSSAGAVTGSEALMLSAFYLSRLKHNNPSVYQLIKEPVEDYLRYCEGCGIVIS